jgi:hypothetical protein
MRRGGRSAPPPLTTSSPRIRSPMPSEKWPPRPRRRRSSVVAIRSGRLAARTHRIGRGPRSSRPASWARSWRRASSAARRAERQRVGAARRLVPRRLHDPSDSLPWRPRRSTQRDVRDRSGDPHGAQPGIAHQRTAYPGVVGVQDVSLGGSGGITVATGTLYGATLLLLAAARTWRAAYVADGGAYTLVDTKGRTWPSVILDSSSSRRGRSIHPWDATWGFTKRFRAKFFHARPERAPCPESRNRRRTRMIPGSRRTWCRARRIWPRSRSVCTLVAGPDSDEPGEEARGGQLGVSERRVEKRARIPRWRGFDTSSTAIILGPAVDSRKPSEPSSTSGKTVGRATSW